MMDGEKTMHDSFGMVQVVRSCASPPGVRLFGSPMRHAHTIRITVAKASVTRDLYMDHHHAEEAVVEIEVSANQWAELVSAFGIGGGVPCTIRRVGGNQMPPVPESGLKQTFEAEVAEKLAGLSRKASDFRRELAAALSKDRLTKDDKRRLLGLADGMGTEIGSNLPFLQEQFHEAMDKAVTAAKAEVTAHAGEVARAMGLEALRGMPAMDGAEPPALPPR